MRFLARVLAGLAGALALGLSVIALLGAAGAQGGRFSDWLDVLAHFAPFWLVAALAALILSLAAPRGRLRLAARWLAATAAVLALALIGLEPFGQPIPLTVPSNTQHVRLVQLNTWSGRNRDIEGTLDWVYAQNAEIVVLEEVKKPMREALKRRGGYHMTCEWSSMCEVVILSREKPTETGVPKIAVGHKFPVARATFATPGGAFTVIGAHFTWPLPPGHQQQQGERLAALIKQFPKDRLIVAGDFNSTPWSFTRKREDRAFGLERYTRGLFTWPRAMGRRRIEVPFPFLAIDHVYAGPGFICQQVKRGPKLGSDHYPVIADFIFFKSPAKPAR